MQLKILVPSRVFTEITNVTRIVAKTRDGELGLLPRRLDCVTALSPGILTYATTVSQEDCYIAVDEGVLIKIGTRVFVSVRHAVTGADLGQLRQAVEKEFLSLDEEEKNVRRVLAKLESNLVRRFAEFHHG